MVRDVKIETVLNGWIVTVGCQKIVFANDVNNMLDAIAQYMSDPDTVEKRYLKDSVNARITEGAPARQATCVDPNVRDPGRIGGGAVCSSSFTTNEAEA